MLTVNDYEVWRSLLHEQYASDIVTLDHTPQNENDQRTSLAYVDEKWVGLWDEINTKGFII